MARSLQEILATLDPTRRAGIEAEAERLHAEYLTMQELRKAKRLTQIQLAKTLGVKQTTVAKYERQSDLLLSTLTSYVRAMGGRQDHAHQRVARRGGEDLRSRRYHRGYARAAMRRAEPRRHADEGRRCLALRSRPLVPAPAARPHPHRRGPRQRGTRSPQSLGNRPSRWRWLDDAETPSYLHGSVSTKRHRVRVPETPMYLDALLADQPLAGGLKPRLGDAQMRVADEKLRLVEKVIQGRDFTATPETINAVDAWLGSLPGHAYANVRQPPISTLNLAHMIPLNAVWAGPERDEHLAAPPLLFGKTEGSTPFRFSLHVGDVGHTLVVGPTGAGKSVLLALMALQFRRYAGSQVFAFDFGGSIRAAALAMGGDWHDLGGGLTDGEDQSVSLQPLSRLGETAERAWAADWVVAILMREGIQITPEVKEHLWTALTSLASAPAGERTITGLAVLLQSNDLKQALRPYCVGGAYGRLLDAETEHLGEASVQAFETEGLIGTGAAPAVLAYLFHRVEDRLDGSPTLIHYRRGLCRSAPRMAEDAPEEERFRRLRHAIALRHRRFGDRARDHRELPDTAAASERARDRTTDHRDLPPLRPQRPADRDSRARHAQARLLLPVAAR